jgi:hypothetical protein
MNREYVNEIEYEPRRSSSRLSNQGYNQLEKTDRIKHPTTVRVDSQKSNNSRKSSSTNNSSTNIKTNEDSKILLLQQKQQEQKQQTPVFNTQTSYPTISRSELKDHMIWSILSLLFFSVLFGGLAIIHSIKTRHRIEEKLFQKARSNSRKAFLFNLASLIIGSLATVLTIILLILVERSRTDAGIFIVVIVFRILL